MEIMHQDFPTLANALSSYSYDDEITKSTIKRVYQNNHYILDPHGAVAFLAAEEFLHDFKSIFK